MSDSTLFGILATVLQSGALAVVIVSSIKLMTNENATFFPFMFVLAMSSYFLSDLYWIAYDLLKPDTRMPIASNEIGECAMILLLSAGLETILDEKQKKTGEVAFAILFIGANIVLWIAWSGEWFQDILFGIPYIYFLWILIRGLLSRKLLSLKEMLFVSVASVSVLMMQIPLFFVKGKLFELTDFLNFVVMFVVMAWLGFKSFQCKDCFVASTFFLWTELSMFLSHDVYYNIALAVNTIACISMFLSMKRELAYDLC